MNEQERFLHDHLKLTRRYFLSAGAVSVGLGSMSFGAEPTEPELAKALEKLEPFFTPSDKFQDVSRGNPRPHSLSDEKKREVGLTQDTWKLEVISDPENPATLGKPLTKKDNTTLDFKGLMELAKTRSVRFPKVMTCLNIGCPLGMGIWEGVPLRDILWLTNPKENLRRVWYYGYHNDDPKQMFRSSLPIDRVLEDPHELPPVILCYKLNGEWLNPHRGGPVRIVVPEAYGFKSVKWLSHIVLTNLYHANDTYANGNNDVDSWLKTFAATLFKPSEIKPKEPIPISGYAQVGIGGLSKVQVWIHPASKEWPAEDPYFTKAPWVDAKILPPPKVWGGNLPNNRIPNGTMGFDEKTNQPHEWPIRLGKIHWVILMPGLEAGDYTLRCRTIDDKGHAQPLPRPFRKSGHAAIEAVKLSVKS